MHPACAGELWALLKGVLKAILDALAVHVRVFDL